MGYKLHWWLRWESSCLQCGRSGFDPWVGKIPWRRKWQCTPVLLPGKSHRQRSLVGYSPWGHKESHTTKPLHFHFFFIYSQHRDFCMLCSLFIVVAWTGSRRTLLLVSTWGYCARLLLLRMVLSKWLFFIQMSVLGQFQRKHTQLRAGGLLGVLSATGGLRRGWGWTVLQIQ